MTIEVVHLTVGESFAMTDTGFLTLFFGTGQVAYEIGNVKRTAAHFRFSVCRLDRSPVRPTHRQYLLKYFESIKAAALPRSPSVADHLLRLLWIRECKFEMDPPTKDELFAMMTRVVDMGKYPDVTAKAMEKGFKVLVQKKCIRAKNKPLSSGASAKSWTQVYSLTRKGEHYAERMVETKKEFFANIKYPKDSESEDRKALHGKKMAAVKFAVDNPTVLIKLIEEQHELKKKSLSRPPYRDMIRRGRNLVRNQSGKHIATEEEKNDHYNHNKLGDDILGKKKRRKR